VRWNDFGRVDLEAEVTEWTERAHHLFYRLAAEAFEPGEYVTAQAGPELRLLVLGGGGYIISVWGQPLSHGRTGAHPARIAELRDLTARGRDVPVLFVGVQGDIGWATWLVRGHEAPRAVIDSARPADPNARRGWLAGDMINLGFSGEALARPSAHPRTAWRWPERAPQPDLEGSLF
jgi:hypothetical protein